MAKQQQSVVVEQHYNPRFNSQNPVDDSVNCEQIYKVEKAVNTLVVKISQTLTPKQVQDLIDSGVNVTIQPVKG